MALINAFPTGDTQLTTVAAWESVLTGLDGHGVIPGVGTNMLATIQSGARTVTLGAGAALVRGIFTSNPSPLAKAVPAASGNDRVDRLVLRLNRSAGTAADWITLVVIQGTPSTSPTPPAISTSPTGNYDLPVCRWTSKADGSLTSLVDERFVNGPGLKTFHSAQRPNPAPADSTWGWEYDTKRLLWYDRALDSWSVIWQDSGYLALTLANTSVWEVPGSPTNTVRVLGRSVEARITIKRKGSVLNGTTSDDDAGSIFATLPVAARPEHDLYFPAYFSGDFTARLKVEASGELRIQMPSTDITVGRILRTTINYQV